MEEARCIFNEKISVTDPNGVVHKIPVLYPPTFQRAAANVVSSRAGTCEFAGSDYRTCANSLKRCSTSANCPEGVECVTYAPTRELPCVHNADCIPDRADAELRCARKTTLSCTDNSSCPSGMGPCDPYVPNIVCTGAQPSKPRNMGGCMGCHGVAQTSGHTFSFVSLDGQRGIGVDTLATDLFDPAPVPFAGGGGDNQ